MALLHLLRVTLAFALLFASARGYECSSPKVRREWRSIEPAERASWIKAVNCLSELQHDSKIVATVDPAISQIPPITSNSSHYDDFVYVHMDLNAVIHQTGFFLPWHRLFVQTFEDVLRSKCGYDGVHPYWDWTQDTANFYNATIFSSSTYDGIGTWGDPNDDFRLFDGGFKDFELAYPVPHILRRNYTNQPFLDGLYPAVTAAGAPPVTNLSMTMNTTFTTEVVDFVVNSNTGDYIHFQESLEDFPGPHGGPHLIVGGDMGGTCPYGLSSPVCIVGMKWSTNDPIFFLHHAMIDKVWSDWQNRDPSNKNIFAGGSVSWQFNPNQSFDEYPTGSPPWLDMSSIIPSDGLWGDIPVSDVMDTVGGRLCYIYA